MQRTILRLTTTLVGLSILALVGCGGGGGGGEPPHAAQRFAAEGFWEGKINNALDVGGVVLENGQYWFFYESEDGFYVLQGTATASNGNFSSSDAREFDLVNGGVIPFNVSGSYRERVSLQGTATPAAGGSPSNFALTYDASYDTPATAAAVSGRWLVTDGVTLFQIEVDGNGAFTGTTSAGCTFGGSIVPRPSGKAVYDLFTRFNGAPCLLGTQTVSGIAVVDGSGPDQVLIGAALNPARNAGFAVIGGR
jgi:hypothetical protein